MLDVEPYLAKLAPGLSPGRQLIEFKEDVCRLIRLNNVKRVRILSAESNYSATYSKMITRITLECVIGIASAELDVDCRRVSRPGARSALDLPQKGKLSVYVNDVVEASGPYWKDKRSLAALVALAGNREGD
ncbi:hypothetical protein [Amycolatopsis magusensis]|uniref:hypothetical protein n=1 Tax=Amycolatopsis magusensis TaxID=882444 RepID=UPI003792859A